MTENDNMEMIMTNLDIAKAIIWTYITHAICGIFNTRNILGDDITTLYNKDGLTIDICYGECYFEVFGLTDREFEELKTYYYACCAAWAGIEELKEYAAKLGEDFRGCSL